MLTIYSYVRVVTENFSAIDSRLDELEKQCVDELTRQGFTRYAWMSPSEFDR